MCFPNVLSSPKQNICPHFDENGAINERSNLNNVVRDGIEEHVDSPFLNKDLDDGILGFIYKNADEIIIVWTSKEAEEMCCNKEIIVQ